MNDRQFKKLLDAFQLSWAGYCKVRKGVKKRILRHMQLLDCRQFDQYLQLIAADLEVRDECRRLLTVSISRLFRDSRVWQVIAGNIIPELVAGGQSVVRVWSAGCAQGEEIYSFKILWHAAAVRLGAMPALQAYATDMNPRYLAATREAVYSASSVREFPEELRSQYLAPVAGQKSRYTLPDYIRCDIHWLRLDLLRDDPPGKDFDLIFLRNNVLTYCQEGLQAAALERVLTGLVPGGYLVIGAKEKLPVTASKLSPHVARTNIFRKEAD